MFLEGSFQPGPLSFARDFVRFPHDASQIKPVTALKILVNRMRRHQGQIRFVRHNRLNLFIEIQEIGFQRCKIALEDFLQLWPLSCHRASDCPRLLCRLVEIQPGRKSGTGMGVLPAGAMAVCRIRLHMDVVIPESRRGIHQRAPWQRNPIDPFRIVRTIEQDQVGLLIAGDDFHGGLPEGGVLVAGCGKGNSGMLTRDTLRKIL